ncbi:hypothetical protein PYCC9005_003696 [Savitreella phatthalungensis]
MSIKSASAVSSAATAAGSSASKLITPVRKALIGKAYRPQLFTQTVILSDGSTVSRMTTSPRSSVRLTRDIRNNPLWNPSSASGVQREETGRLARFRDRFAGYGAPAPIGSDKEVAAGKKVAGPAASATDDLDWLVDTSAGPPPKMSDREQRDAAKKKK